MRQYQLSSRVHLIYSRPNFSNAYCPSHLILYYIVLNVAAYTDIDLREKSYLLVNAGLLITTSRKMYKVFNTQIREAFSAEKRRAFAFTVLSHLFHWNNLFIQKSKSEQETLYHGQKSTFEERHCI